MLIPAAVTVVMALCTSLALTRLMRRWAPRLGLMDEPEARKIHARTTPTGGGIAIFVATMVPVALGLIVAAGVASGWAPAWLPQTVKDEAPTLLSRWRLVAAVFAGGALFFVIGLIDDLKGTSARLRLILEIVIALGLYAFVPEVRITLLVGVPGVSAILTVLWIVGIANAFNLLDNMDGLSAGVALIASMIFLGFALPTGQLFIAGLLFALTGALGGFLWFNRPRASIFMGDAGSLFIGYMLAVLTAASTYYNYESGRDAWLSFLLPVLLLAVPIFDVASVVFIRLKEGRSVFEPDRKHFSHRLVKLGMTQGEALLTIYIVTFCVGIAAVLLPTMRTAAGVVLAVQALAVFSIIVLLERAGGRGK